MEIKKKLHTDKIYISSSLFESEVFSLLSMCRGVLDILKRDHQLCLLLHANRLFWFLAKVANYKEPFSSKCLCVIKIVIKICTYNCSLQVNLTTFFLSFFGIFELYSLVTYYFFNLLTISPFYHMAQ